MMFKYRLIELLLIRKLNQDNTPEMVGTYQTFRQVRRERVYFTTKAFENSLKATDFRI